MGPEWFDTFETLPAPDAPAAHPGPVTVKNTVPSFAAMDVAPARFDATTTGDAPPGARYSRSPSVAMQSTPPWPPSSQYAPLASTATWMGFTRFLARVSISPPVFGVLLMTPSGVPRRPPDSAQYT